MLRQTHRIFAIDGLGAAASAAAAGALLISQSPWFGMPATALLWFTGVAGGFAVYSLGCWWARAPLVPWLPIVMVANAAYGAVLLASLVHYAQVLTPLGTAYFCGEAIVIFGLVLYEFRVVRGEAKPR